MVKADTETDIATLKDALERYRSIAETAISDNKHLREDIRQLRAALIDRAADAAIIKAAYNVVDGYGWAEFEHLIRQRRSRGAS